MSQLERFGSEQGYSWNSYSDLSIQLGHAKGYVSLMLKRHPTWGLKDLLQVKRKVAHEHCGIKWTSFRELSQKLGKCPTYVTDQRINNPGITIEEIIRKAQNSKRL